MHQSSILVAWINDGRPPFLLWLRQRLQIVFGEGIWGCSRCNSAIDFFWVVKVLETPSTARCPAVESFLLTFSGTRHDFKGFELVSISVSFCDLGVELYSQDLAKFLWCCLFQDIFFKMAGSGLAPATENLFIHCLWSGSKDYVCLFTAAELGLRSCIALFETTGNLETCTVLRQLWICCCVIFVCSCFAGLGIIRILSRWWRKHVKIFVKMDTECWKLLVK